MTSESEEESEPKQMQAEIKGVKGAALSTEKQISLLNLMYEESSLVCT